MTKESRRDKEDNKRDSEKQRGTTSSRGLRARIAGRKNSDMNLSFAGCGFLGIYHVGVAVCFKKYAPHLLLDKISGASAGAIAACSLLCDLPLGE